MFNALSSSAHDNLRYIVSCITVLDSPVILNLVVDTGAMYTSCNIKDISDKIRESDLSGCEVAYIGGLVNGSKIKYYKYLVKQFTIGTIDLGSKYIWVTFDDRSRGNLLGMDIMKDVPFLHDNENKVISFFKTMPVKVTYF